MTADTNQTLARQLETELGENVYLCYQCVKCASGCPLADEFDLTPNQIMRALQLEQDDRVLNSKSIWLCASCQTCVTRCPHQLDLPRINDHLCITANNRGIAPKLRDIALFRKVFLRHARWLGRVFELGLIAEMNLRMRQPFKDFRMGLEMFRKGKVRLLPSLARTPKHPEKIPQQPNRIAYYPGCSLHSVSSEFDRSTKAVLEALGLELHEPKGWTCCGASPAHGSDTLLGLTMPMRNLALIEQTGFREVLAPCTSCYSRFKAAQHDLEKRPDLKKQVESKLGQAGPDGIAVKSLLDVLEDRIGLEQIAKHVKRPLRGLKVASYYGCLLTRPPKVTGAAHPENPMGLERVVDRLGATVVDWSYKLDCCGGSLSLTRPDIVLRLTRKILDNARAVGADLVVTACPLCHVNLDARQAALNLDKPLPILFITQLMGLAFGLDPRAVALQKNMVDPAAVIARAVKPE